MALSFSLYMYIIKLMNKENLKIEFKTVRILGITHYRYCFWRIVPSELGLFQRLFSNPWRQLWFIHYGAKETWFSPYDFSEVKSKYKTVGDMAARKEKLEEGLKTQWNSIAESWKEVTKKDGK